MEKFKIDKQFVLNDIKKAKMNSKSDTHFHVKKVFFDRYNIPYKLELVSNSKNINLTCSISDFIGVVRGEKKEVRGRKVDHIRACYEYYDFYIFKRFENNKDTFVIYDKGYTGVYYVLGAYMSLETIHSYIRTIDTAKSKNLITLSCPGIERRDIAIVVDFVIKCAGLRTMVNKHEILSVIYKLKMGSKEYFILQRNTEDKYLRVANLILADKKIFEEIASLKNIIIDDLKTISLPLVLFKDFNYFKNKSNDLIIETLAYPSMLKALTYNIEDDNVDEEGILLDDEEDEEEEPECPFDKIINGRNSKAVAKKADNVAKNDKTESKVESKQCSDALDIEKNGYVSDDELDGDSDIPSCTDEINYIPGKNKVKINMNKKYQLITKYFILTRKENGKLKTTGKTIGGLIVSEDNKVRYKVDLDTLDALAQAFMLTNAVCYKSGRSTNIRLIDAAARGRSQYTGINVEEANMLVHGQCDEILKHNHNMDISIDNINKVVDVYKGYLSVDTLKKYFFKDDTNDTIKILIQTHHVNLRNKW